LNSAPVRNFNMPQKNIFGLITEAAWVSIIAIAYAATMVHVGFAYIISYRRFLMRPENENLCSS
jgi:hypothetical protein